MSITISGTNITFSDNSTQATALTQDFPAGTTTIFMQSSSPTGWTKSVAIDDATLRVISGTVGTGGTLGFTSALGASKVSDSSTIATGAIPAHTHGSGWRVYWAGANRFTGNAGYNYAANNYTDYQGGAGAHNHTLNLDLQYADVIVASKD